MTDNEPMRKPLHAGLTERQRQCMELVDQGYSSKQIARSLGISPSTVDNHIHAAVVKLGATTRQEAARRGRSGTEPETEPPSGPSDSPAIEEEENHSASTLPNQAQFLRLPPIGGIRNESKISERFSYVIQVALMGIMVFAALTATIAGVIRLLSR